MELRVGTLLWTNRDICRPLYRRTIQVCYEEEGDWW